MYKIKAHFIYSYSDLKHIEVFTDFNIKQVKRNFELKNSYIES